MSSGFKFHGGQKATSPVPSSWPWCLFEMFPSRHLNFPKQNPFWNPPFEGRTYLPLSWIRGETWNFDFWLLWLVVYGLGVLGDWAIKNKNVKSHKSCIKKFRRVQHHTRCNTADYTSFTQETQCQKSNGQMIQQFSAWATNKAKIWSHFQRCC